MEGPGTKRRRIQRQDRAVKRKAAQDAAASVPENKRSRKLANTEAEVLLASGCAITDETILRVLRQFEFSPNMTRANVMPRGVDFVFSETLGLVSTRNGKVTVSKLTKCFPAIFHILALWLRHSWPLADRFPFTSISVNKNYAARMSVSS